MVGYRSGRFLVEMLDADKVRASIVKGKMNFWESCGEKNCSRL